MGESLLLLTLAAAGLLGGNDAVGIAALVALGVRAVGSAPLLEGTAHHSLHLGILFLVLSLLLNALSTGQQALTLFSRMVGTPAGLLSLVVGFYSTRMAADGITLMQRQPEALLGLVMGSLIGVWVLGGVPVGPLVAAGIVQLLLRVWPR
ncbi:MAG: DUF441 family protein [Limnochordaceae bacterium]|uniref:DUF441 family protein n=1 Tax=Carboxydichorda subterranea TaxID=3109565 RepID=A0ABZ1BXV1_9FIRM|nr:DUF441 family protein [Limnochorda sp. L945t]MBE3599117.1 DUF441 family protein [Limnochordaceae bacterium]WRP17636.1 DUF441 family protein [Limnochorda sp. L945t]